MHNIFRTFCTRLSYWVASYTTLVDSCQSICLIIIKWKYFPRYWPFVRGIHRSSVNSPHKGQWRGALMFSSICVGINCWPNNRDPDDLRCHQAHYEVAVVCQSTTKHNIVKRSRYYLDLLDNRNWWIRNKLYTCIWIYIYVLYICGWNWRKILT